MKGIAQIIDGEIPGLTSDISQSVTDLQKTTFSGTFRETLRHYFRKLEGNLPVNLYDIIMSEVEQPLIDIVLKCTGNNQSKAAKILGISRGTLRKKIALYQQDDSNQDR